MGFRFHNRMRQSLSISLCILLILFSWRTLTTQPLCPGSPPATILTLHPPPTVTSASLIHCHSVCGLHCPFCRDACPCTPLHSSFYRPSLKLLHPHPYEATAFPVFSGLPLSGRPWNLQIVAVPQACQAQSHPRAFAHAVSSPSICMTRVLTSSRSLLGCHLLREVPSSSTLLHLFPLLSFPSQHISRPSRDERPSCWLSLVSPADWAPGGSDLSSL